jgi:hypothetical protein
MEILSWTKDHVVVPEPVMHGPPVPLTAEMVRKRQVQAAACTTSSGTKIVTAASVVAYDEMVTEVVEDFVQEMDSIFVGADFKGLASYLPEGGA